MEPLIERFGPVVVFFGLMAEGEVALILAGYALHHGYLPLLPTLFWGTAGGTVSDSVYYWLGRRFGARLLRSRPKLRPFRARAILLLRRRGHIMAFLVRFAFGLRIVLPIAMGAARMHPRVFHTYNAMGAFAFAVVYLAAGYGVGTAITRMIREAGLTEGQVLGAIVALIAIAWVVREWRIYRSAEEPAPRRGLTRRR